mmetsp:Transcript_12706/g.28185  ORF Transcript_12706/g.28185 Transcript_12706/m.28185 type:complete len:215 (-) Transcript_12706:3744-4388(-)
MLFLSRLGVFGDSASAEIRAKKSSRETVGSSSPSAVVATMENTFFKDCAWFRWNERISFSKRSLYVSKIMARIKFKNKKLDKNKHQIHSRPYARFCRKVGLKQLMKSSDDEATNMVYKARPKVSNPWFTLTLAGLMLTLSSSSVTPIHAKKSTVPIQKDTTDSHSLRMPISARNNALTAGMQNMKTTRMYGDIRDDGRSVAKIQMSHSETNMAK